MIKGIRMKRAAFTILELVFVIVVLGIIAALAIPRMDRDLKQEAADNILSAVRYTQHLALHDNKQMFNNAQWQRRFWRIYFGTCNSDNKMFYAIGSDNDMTGSTNGVVASSEAAIDPANGKKIWAVNTDCADSNISQNVLIGKKYGVVSLTASGGCQNQYIGFDHLGRPYGSAFTNSSTPDNAGLISSECNLTFGMSDGDTFTITIQPETGYAQIAGQPDS